MTKTAALLTVLMGFSCVACEDGKSAGDGAATSKPAATAKAASTATAKEAPTKQASADAEEAADGAVTCKAFATQLVKLLSEQGAQAVLKDKDVPKLTEACEKGETLDKEKETVECAMKAGGMKDAQGCKDLNRVLKGLMAKM